MELHEISSTNLQCQVPSAKCQCRLHAACTIQIPYIYTHTHIHTTNHLRNIRYFYIRKELFDFSSIRKLDSNGQLFSFHFLVFHQHAIIIDHKHLTFNGSVHHWFDITNFLFDSFTFFTSEYLSVSKTGFIYSIFKLSAMHIITFH